jgi:hypothetical protein
MSLQDTITIAYWDRFLADELGELFGAFWAPLTWGSIGGFCFVIVRQIYVRLRPAHQTEGLGAPVVYLRSFYVDQGFSRRPRPVGRPFSVRTEEEQLAKALREIGPVVAIGKPGERLPRLGANRIYVRDEDWQEQVLSWFARAALVGLNPAKPKNLARTWRVIGRLM